MLPTLQRREYVSAGDDPQAKNDNYVGVSSWWEPSAAPPSFAGTSPKGEH